MFAGTISCTSSNIGFHGPYSLDVFSVVSLCTWIDNRAVFSLVLTIMIYHLHANKKWRTFGPLLTVGGNSSELYTAKMSLPGAGTCLASQMVVQHMPTSAISAAFRIGLL